MENVKKHNPLLLAILVVDKSITGNMDEVKTRDIYEQNSTVFNGGGLFSTTIFGESGSSERMETYGFINLGLEVFHPRIYREICSLSSLYKDILNGKRFVLFDDKELDFIESTEEEGYTGYNYFIKHYKKIDFKKEDSVISRQVTIEFVDMFTAKESLVRDYLVIPAGLREYTVKENGKVFEDEINAIYRKLITTAYTAKMFQEDNQNNMIINKVKVRLQYTINAIYEYIENILDGKGGYLQNKQTKRAISYGTRNVIGSTPEIILDADDESRPDALTSIAGIYQVVKGIYPLALFQLRTKYLHDVFDDESTRARLINTKTLKRETINISEKARSDWVTDDGIEKILNKLKQNVIKKSPIIVDGHYLFLVYDTGDDITIVNNVDKLPDGYDVKMVRPITYGELFYVLLNPLMKDQIAYIVRYPIADKNSIVPTKVALKSTITGRRVNLKILDELESKVVNEYPKHGEAYYYNLSPSVLFIESLGADYDGTSS